MAGKGRGRFLGSGAALAAAGALLSACGSPAGPPGGTSTSAGSPSTASAPGPASRTEGAPVSTVDPALGAFVAAAVSDLAARLGINAKQVSVVSARAVTWPDAALGCPRPGMAYAQVQVDGTRIELAAEGRAYAYHSGGSRGPFLCENRPA